MPSQPSLFSHLKTSQTLVVLWLLASVLGGWLAYQGLLRLGLSEAQAVGNNRLDFYASSLQREADRFAFLPAVVVLQPDVQQLLQTPQDAALQLRVNQYLETLNSRAGTLSAYLLDRKGHVLAASNWQRPDSFVGEDLSFRPYTQQALTYGKGRYFGIGTTRGEPGYYLTTRWGEGESQGIAVVKVGLEQLELFSASGAAPVLVSDENEVVILSNRADWRFATLKPLSEERRSALQTSLQYNGRTLEPLGWTWLPGPAGVQQVRLPGSDSASSPRAREMPTGPLFLAQSRPLPGTPWNLTALTPLTRTLQLAQSRAWLAGAMTALALLMLQLTLQRRRHQRALAQAHQTLELKVRQRTADLQTANTSLQQEVAERIQAEKTLRAAQNELVQAGKMAAIGQLSTELAHGLNQPLAALRTLAGNSQRFLERGQADMAQRNLQRMADLADRMGTMTGQLRQFARKSEGEVNAVHAVTLIEGALAVLDVRIARSAAIIVSTLKPPGLQAWCDAHRVQQVLVNLLSNALDAMQGNAQPKIEIEAQQQGEWVQITVRDHGPGLSEDSLQRLFEPFFTTKPEGLGLGLSLSADILRGCGGSLQARNHEAGGAVFQVLLPIVDTRHSADAFEPS